MGQSARRVIDLLRVWDTNRDNADELFWQSVFNEHAYAMNQVFAYPVVFIKDNAYVGGMNVDRKNAKLVDYLFSAELSREAILIEIKTPKTRLLAGEYRAEVYPPASELSGAVVQGLTYRSILMTKLASVIEGTPHKLKSFSPKCVVLAGNAAIELDTEAKRMSFELFRSTLKDAEIVTYDELFRKLEVLASLFNLVRRTPPTAPAAS